MKDTTLVLSFALSFCVVVAAAVVHAAPAGPPPLTDETLVLPPNNAELVPVNARLFVDDGSVLEIALDGAAATEPKAAETDPHPGFDGLLIEGLAPETAHVLDLFGATENDFRELRFSTAEGPDTTAPYFEGDIEIRQDITFGGYDIVAVLPYATDDFSVARIGVFSKGGGIAEPALFDSRTGDEANERHELRVPSVPSGEEREIQVVVVDGAGNEGASEVFTIIAGEGCGCSAGTENPGALVLALACGAFGFHPLRIRRLRNVERREHS